MTIWVLGIAFGHAVHRNISGTVIMAGQTVGSFSGSNALRLRAASVHHICTEHRCITISESEYLVRKLQWRNRIERLSKDSDMHSHAGDTLENHHRCSK